MNIADEGKKIVILIAENGFVTVFEKVPDAAMFAVEVLRVPGEEFAHDG